MDMVLGISMSPTMVRLVLVEGQNADGVTVEEDHFAVAVGEDSATPGAADRVIAAIVGTREGATEGGHQVTSAGVTWTDPAEAGALRDAIASHDVGRVMLVSPLLAAAALAQTMADALDYEHIAMLYVERDSATLAVVDAADGSIVDMRRQPLAGEVEAELAAMVAGLDAPGSCVDGVFVVGCGSGYGADVVAIKAGLEAALAIHVIVPEEPDMALARGAALASANAPLFASSTAALAYSLDPGTGEVTPGALSPTYLDVCGNAGDGALAYSALEDFAADDDVSARARRPLVLAGSALAAVAAGLVVVSLPSDARPTSAPQPTPGAVAPANRVPPPEAQLPAPSPPAPAPALAAPPAPAPEVAAPPEAAPEAAAPPAPPAPAPAVQQTPPTPVNVAPAPAPRRVPARRAPQSAPAPVQQAPAPPPPAAPPPAAPPPQPAAVPGSPPQYPGYRRPPLTIYLHFPFVTIPVPLNPPAPAAPPPPGA